MNDPKEQWDVNRRHRIAFQPTYEIAQVKGCGCWVVNLGQGKAVLPCADHQAGVLEAIEEPKEPKP